MQMDLFGLMAKPLRLEPIARIPRSYETGDHWSEWLEADHASLAAGTSERISWGSEKLTDQRSYVLDLWHGDLGWRWRGEYQFACMGGMGQYSLEIYETRAAAMLAAFRRRLRENANLIAVWRDNEGDRRKANDLTSWIIKNANPVDFGGVNLREEYETMLADEVAREKRRGIALRAAHAASKAVDDILRALNLWGYSGASDTGLIYNPDNDGWAGRCEDRESHAKAWPGHWSVGGHAPDRLTLNFYPSQGQSSNPAYLRAIEAVREGQGCPVILHDEGWSYPLASWTWDEA
jgi:hypothetical protein